MVAEASCVPPKCMGACVLFSCRLSAPAVVPAGECNECYAARMQLGCCVVRCYDFARVALVCAPLTFLVSCAASHILNSVRITSQTTKAMHVPKEVPKPYPMILRDA